jgi:YggT family protein
MRRMISKKGCLMNFIIILLIKALDIYFWIIIAGVLLSWLVALDVLNIRNNWVRKVYELVNRVTDPPLRQLRRFVPPIGAMDLTPMVLIFGIYLVQSALIQMLR